MSTFYERNNNNPQPPKRGLSVMRVDSVASDIRAYYRGILSSSNLYKASIKQPLVATLWLTSGEDTFNLLYKRGVTTLYKNGLLFKGNYSKRSVASLVVE